MDESITRALQTAYQLIKSGRLQAAREILIPIVRVNPDLADAWLLLGFALSDPQKQIQSFQQVLRISPSNETAQKQIAKLLAGQSTAPLSPSNPTRMTQTAPYSVSGSAKKPAQKPSPSIFIWALAGLAGLFLCFGVFGVWWIYQNGLPTALVAATSVAAPLPTNIPTATLVPLTTTPQASPIPTFIPVFRGTACPFDVPLGRRVRCGVVSVPQDRAKNFTDLIDIPVVIYQSTKANADVIIYLQGGPGEESINWSLDFFQDYVTPILQDFDMVFFDPRGTGRTKPALDCPELNAVFLDGYFQNRSEDQAFQDFTTTWTKCHDRFVAEGINPAAFNTTQSAGDVHDIAMALGYKQVNLLGISYGTRLGLTIMRDYPEIVRAAVLDSVVPMEGKMFNRRATDVDYALKKVFTDCAASPRCNTAYPDLESVFNGLIDRFDKDPVTIKAFDPSTGFTLNVKTNGVDMLGAVVWGLHTSELVPVVPKAIYDTQKGDYTFLSYALGVPGGSYNTLGMGTYFSTVCPEQVYASTAQEIDTDLNLSPVLKKFGLAGLFGSSQNVFDLCKAWGARSYDPRDSEPMKANIPTLVISGQYDPTTPVTTGEMVANDLPDSHFFIIPGMGHGATIGNDCSMRIMLAFLLDPARTPDSACLRQTTFEFFIPYDGSQPVTVIPLNEPALRLNGIVPAGWKKDINSTTYYRHAYLFDPTLVDYESFPATKEVTLDYLKSSFEKNGFDTTPKKIGGRSANGLNWTIYSSSYNGEPVLLGLAEIDSNWTVGLLMRLSAPEQDAYFNGLFLPILDSISPK